MAMGRPTLGETSFRSLFTRVKVSDRTNRRQKITRLYLRTIVSLISQKPDCSINGSIKQSAFKNQAIRLRFRGSDDDLAVRLFAFAVGLHAFDRRKRLVHHTSLESRKSI